MDRRLRELERAFSNGSVEAGASLFHELERLGLDERAVEVLLSLPEEALSPTERLQRRFHSGRRVIAGVMEGMDQRTNEFGCRVATNYSGGHDFRDLITIANRASADLPDVAWFWLYETGFQAVLSSPILLAELSLTEGDLAIVLCPNREAYVAQAESACEFYGIEVPDWVRGE